MRQLSAVILSIVLFAIALNANAQQAATVNIPEKVKAEVLKRHPKAQDLQASYETHFGQKLLEVSFKEEGENRIAELYRADNHLFTDKSPLPHLSEVPAAIIDIVKKDFPLHELKKAELIVNPNAAGEEYQLYLLAEGYNWKVVVDVDKGKIVAKERY
jgi:hypothetical protein